MCTTAAEAGVHALSMSEQRRGRKEEQAGQQTGRVGQSRTVGRLRLADWRTFSTPPPARGRAERAGDEAMHIEEVNEEGERGAGKRGDRW